MANEPVELSEEDDALMTESLLAIAERGLALTEEMLRNAQDRIPRAVGFPLNQLRRYIARLQEGELHPDWTPEKRAAVARVMERSMHQEVELKSVMHDLRELIRVYHLLVATYSEESRDISSATTHLVKETARMEGDRDAVREVNRARRQARRSRRR